MHNTKPSSDATKRFTTDELITVATPVLLIVLVVITIFIAPKIVQSWEVERCLAMKATFNFDKGECVVTKKEIR